MRGQAAALTLLWVACGCGRGFLFIGLPVEEGDQAVLLQIDGVEAVEAPQNTRSTAAS